MPDLDELTLSTNSLLGTGVSDTPFVWNLKFEMFHWSTWAFVVKFLHFPGSLTGIQEVRVLCAAGIILDLSGAKGTKISNFTSANLRAKLSACSARFIN